MGELFIRWNWFQQVRQGLYTKNRGGKGRCVFSHLPLIFMKRALYFLLLLLLSLSLIALLSACKKKSQSAVKEYNKPSIGIIETKDSKYESCIHWYGFNGEKVGEMDLKYANLGSSFYSPQRIKDDVYLIPEGLGNKRDTKKVIRMNLKSLEIEEYPFSNIALNHTTVIGKRVYAVNTLNNDTYLEFYDRKSKKNRHIVRKNSHIPSIIPIDNKIVGFRNEENENPKDTVIFMEIYNRDLKLKYTKDITGYGFPGEDYCEDKHFFYLPVAFTSENKSTGKILKINKKNFNIEEISVPEIKPDRIYIHNGEFLITDHDQVDGTGTRVMRLRPDGKKKIIDLKTPISLSYIFKEYFIVANDEIIQIHDIKDFKLVKKIPLKDKDDSYTSAILLRNP